MSSLHPQEGSIHVLVIAVVVSIHILPVISKLHNATTAGRQVTYQECVDPKASPALKPRTKQLMWLLAK